MNAGYFIAIVLVSGFVAGTIHGAVNLAIVEPYLDKQLELKTKISLRLGKPRIPLSFGLNTTHIVIGKKAASC